MEESLVVDVLNDEHTVEGNASTKPLLEVSVSFGRFENDLLSWEKWSTFSPNKYLEEVEKYATPGSVAQKRAYFEAHYKKIADRKTKLLEQEREMEFNTTVSNGGADLMDHSERADSESETSNHHVSVEEVDQSTMLTGEVSSSVYHEVVKNDVESNVECESLPDGEKEEPEGKFDCVGSDSEIRKQEEVVVKEVETPTPPVESSQTTKETPQKSVNKVSAISKVKQQILKPNRPKESKKTTPIVKERNSAGVKKKPVSSTAKAPQTLTPKLSKTTPGPTTPAARSSVLRSSVNKGSNSSLLRSRNPSSVESKKVAPKSLHMSLSLGTPNSDPSSVNGIRRSFIMEKMGDKDIVKRAFKTFQNSLNQMKSSPQEEKSSAPKMVPAKERETTKISTSVAAKKENGGMHKLSGTIRGADNKTARVAPSQKLEGKVNAKVIGRTNLQSKSKVAPSQKMEEKFNAREGGRTNLLSKSKDASRNGLRS
ncbi:protein WVD2-like 7 [Cucumis melo var. makuwa]|uniref:Protein WVD2-like 7 n=2 Tax=Cucumis melo TaxID=3656 RepID=A0A1S3BFB5_CUCME|nr:protein WVD2-like 7 [Cucumis melo]XP_008446269.1 protein WVD2-like 7 [Cucumis melo]XP_008446270.1 protein WVD2-like 7 [Cucumis melo]XP_016900238.1 protein WVD2-like 7 [Cucumis melo]XP_050947131.1 protein WVD2-like 7 [Cucumis melo]XP_050947132.1 protein WVD2-like 7 [Cucumis melo]XP_050947133.1 protein WVD2-like 7 [Cucumis melo]XP_050947134.1 protein WVD2-like 7 [Cucumis melo]XP_050947135.1 protein WVD2-like 7 [Cucumis melo]KAA0034349.1 protein WVD2-like 7 [Cucumis melo var. makuwa]TYK15